MNKSISKVVAFCALSLAVNQVPAMQMIGESGSGPAITADASVKPVINVKSKGVLTISVLSAGAFRAEDLQPDTIRVGPAGAPVFGRAHLVDLNNDGTADLLLQFETQATGITCGTTDLTLTGTMLNGQAFRASDQIVTKGC